MMQRLAFYWCRPPRWVAFPRAGIAVEELERRFHYPTCARMPCMLLYGDSGMGKIDDSREDGTTTSEYL